MGLIDDSVEAWEEEEERKYGEFHYIYLALCLLYKHGKAPGGCGMVGRGCMYDTILIEEACDCTPPCCSSVY